MWDFIKNEFVESPDVVPEPYRGLYAEDKESGKYKLNPAVKALGADYTSVNSKLAAFGQKKKNDNEKDAARRVTIDSIVTSLGELGIELNGEDGELDLSTLPDKVKGTIGDLMAKVKGGKDAGINIENLKKKFATDLRNAQAGFDGERKAMEGSLQKYMIKGDAIKALTEKGAVSPDLLMPHVMSAAQVLKLEDGEYGVRIRDANGDVRPNSRGEPMTVGEYVDELKQQFPAAFKSEAKKGTGHEPNKGKPASKVLGDQAKDNMSSTDKIRQGLLARGRG